MKNLFLIAGIFISILSFGQDVKKNDYKVYSKIINSFNDDCLEDWQLKKNKNIVINTSSDFYNFFKKDKSYPENLKYFCHSCVNWKNNKPSYDTLFINMILKLDTVNKLKINFENKFKIKRFKTKILSDIKFNSYFKKDEDVRWNEFYKDFPKSIGYMTLSKIAYSTDKKLCSIYIEISFGSLGGEGYILLLNTKDYKIVKKELLWQS